MIKCDLTKDKKDFLQERNNQLIKICQKITN